MYCYKWSWLTVADLSNVPFSLINVRQLSVTCQSIRTLYWLRLCRLSAQEKCDYVLIWPPWYDKFSVENDDNNKNIQPTNQSSRRTADVRSVGYSELFVLSREDVLSALKDHPDAEVCWSSLCLFSLFCFCNSLNRISVYFACKNHSKVARVFAKLRVKRGICQAFWSRFYCFNVCIYWITFTYLDHALC